MDISKEDLHKITRSLENDKYTGRTIKGIAVETGLPPDLIQEVISKDTDNIVHLSKLSTDGKDFYTTRQHYSKKSPALRRMLGAFKNRIS